MLRRLGIGKILAGGGLFAGAALIILGLGGDWKLDAAALLLMGLGFYMLHNTFQAQVTEVAPGARASAVALHAFSFFSGQALGVVLMGFGLHSVGLTGATADRGPGHPGRRPGRILRPDAARRLSAPGRARRPGRAATGSSAISPVCQNTSMGMPPRGYQ